MILYERKKNHADKVVRCYLTLNCNSNCRYCSAGVPKICKEKKAEYIPAEVWAEGINRRNRPVILCGGEPFLYSEFEKLMGFIDIRIKVEIYTNLGEGVDVRPFISTAKKKYIFLISLHESVKDFNRWHESVLWLNKNGHSTRFHVVKQGNWQERKNFLQGKGYKVTCCDDQNSYKKSKKEDNAEYPLVNCKTRYFVFGPDGYRYSCITLMGKNNSKKFEHISENDSNDWLNIYNCTNYGKCVGCDNLHEGITEYFPESVALSKEGTKFGILRKTAIKELKKVSNDCYPYEDRLYKIIEIILPLVSSSDIREQCKNMLDI